MGSPDDQVVDEVDELEELDAVELIEESGQANPPATPPTPPAVPPPAPPRPPPPPRPATAPMAARSADDDPIDHEATDSPPGSNGVEADSSVDIDMDMDAGEASGDDPGAGVATDPSAEDQEAAAPEPAAPLEAQLEIPTVIDRAVEEIKSGDAGPRAARLAADLQHAGDDRRRAALIAYELGELEQRYHDDEAAAVKAFDRALRADPTLRPNLWAIRRLIVGRELWPKLIKLLDAETRIARSDTERADLQVEKGALLAGKLADRDGAREAFERAVALDPGSVVALMSLERLALEDDDAETLARVWRALAQACHNPGRKLAYLLDLIRLKAQPGADDEALAEARQLLVEAVGLAADAGATERVARERERLAELSGDPAEMLGALEARVGNVRAQYGPQGPPAAPAGAREPGAPLDRADELRLTIVALRRRQARIARDEANDGERAWGYLEKALALAPGEPLILADLADLAERLGKFEELAELCRGWESLEGDSTRSLSLSLRRAEALLRGGQREQGDALLEQLSAAHPGYLPITALRERDALTEGGFAALAEVYREAGEAARLGTSFGPAAEGGADLAGAAAYFVCAAELQASYVGDPERARDLYQRALEAVPGHAAAAEGLSVLLERTGKLEEAAALIELQADSADSEARGYLLERLTRIYSMLGKPDELVSALQRKVALAPDSGPGSVLIRWRLDEALVGYGRTEQRVPVLVDIAERTADPIQKAAVLLEAARLCDFELGDADRAAGLYRSVLELVPDDRFARAALVSMLRRAGRWQDVVAERIAEAGQLEDGPAVSRVLREAAGVLRDRLGKSAEAVEIYRSLLERVPDDRFALCELAEALADAGDTDGLIDVLERRAEASEDPGALFEILLAEGEALEAAGRTEDAIYAYRRAADVGSGAHAQLAMAELSARSGDAATEVEALDQLAAARPVPAIAGALREEIGWRWALTLEDYDRAAEAFEQAMSTAGNRRSAAIGASLIQAKRGERVAAGDALVALADTVHGAYASSSLLLRAAAIAEVAGDVDQARARVNKAAATAPDDGGTLVVAAEYLPADITAEVTGGAEELIQRASICAMRAAIASDPAAADQWELDQAEALEAAGQLAEAGQIVSGVLANRHDDLRALQLLRRLCARGGQREGLARASVALARLLGDREGKLELLREAAEIFDRELNDMASAVAVYRALAGEDAGAPEVDRLLAIYREHDDVRGLVEMLGERLNWIDQDEASGPEASVPYLAERARLRAGIGDKRGASRDLVVLLERDPDHAEALVSLARLRADEGNAREAADLFRRYLTAETDPHRRAEVELTLSEILAEDMDDIAGAVGRLDRVLAQAPDDIDVRERLIGLLLKGGDWQRAVKELREIEKRRRSNPERARDELRVAGILRDRLSDTSKARAALERARQLDPLNVDAVRELAELVGESRRGDVLAHAASDVRQAIVADPGRAALYERLSVISRWKGDSQARYYAVSALGALSTLSSEQRNVVDRLTAAVGALPLPSGAVDDDAWRARVADAELHGALEVWSTLAEGASKLVGLEAGRLGFSRGDRIGMRSLDREWPELARVLSAFGAQPGEIYVSESKAGYARAVSGAKPALYLGADVARAKGVAARFSLGRAVAMVRDNTGTLAELRGTELVLLFAAAAKLAGIDSLPEALAGAGSPAAIDEKARELQKAMSRRDRKALAGLGDRLGRLPEPSRLRRAAMVTAARAGLLVGGDLGAALDVLDVGRGARPIRDDSTALSLLSWAVGDDHLALRNLLGVTIESSGGRGIQG